MTSVTYSFPIPAAPMSPLVAGTSSMEEAQRRQVLQRHGVRVMGQDKPPMLLCNGFGCTQQIWHYLTAALAVRYQVIVFDYVGSGASDLSAYTPHKYATLAAYAQDVVEICQALDLRETVLVGHSVGATIAMLAAIQAPQHFAKAVLLAPSPCYINEPGYYGGFERADLLQVLAAMEVNYQSWTTTFADLLMGPTSMTSLREELANRFCETNSTIARQFAQLTFLSDNRADVRRLGMPTLVVQCADDVAGGGLLPPAFTPGPARHAPHIGALPAFECPIGNLGGYPVL